MKLAARATVGIAAAALATTMATTPAQAAPARYNITLITCNVEDADTDERVEARLNGDISSPWLPLEYDGPHETGLPESYYFTMQPLGPIRSVDLAFDYHGDPWCLDEVVVSGPDGVTHHPFHNWLRRKYTKSFPLRLHTA